MQVWNSSEPRVFTVISAVETNIYGEEADRFDSLVSFYTTNTTERQIDEDAGLIPIAVLSRLPART